MILKTTILTLVAASLFWSCEKTEGNGVVSSTDSFTVTVNNGYGSGRYKVGDTVHVFSENYADDQLFDHWSDDMSLLNDADEWHSWFIMPAKEVTLTANLRKIVNFTLRYEQIKGKDILKPVYYYLPKNEKGIVYLLHGTGGSAATLIANYEWQQLIKSLVDDHFGVIITEAEESTLRTDSNGDSKIRWSLLPFDTLANVDFDNIRIITNSFYDRGLADRSVPRYSIGMSDGGFFSTALSTIYHFKAGVNYCAQGSKGIIDISNTPVQFCMARFDSNPQIGPKGNAQALANSAALNARGVCSHFLIKERCPLYSQRFARRGDISLTQSAAIFNELKSKGYLDNRNYFLGVSDDLKNAYKANPQSFPVINSLTLNQQIFVMSQIGLSVSDHSMYSDYDAATLKFLNNPCK